MKNEYEQSPIEERRMWREKQRNKLIAKLNEQVEKGIIEKSVKFVR